MFSNSFFQASSRLAHRKDLLMVVGVVLAAGTALLFGDAHSIGMTHN